MKIRETEKSIKSKESYKKEWYGRGASDWDSSARDVELPTVGEVYMTYTVENARTGEAELMWSASALDLRDGLPGNMDQTRSHNGWRGTTNDIAVYATGRRVCTRAEKVELKTVVQVRIEFGENETPATK